MKHYPVGALVYLDGEVLVRVQSWWPEGSTSQHGSHYCVREYRTLPAVSITLADRTGARTQQHTAPCQTFRTTPERLGVKKKRR